MTDIRKLAFVGLMGLGLATLGSAGCSSSSGSSGTGGSTGTGGTGTGTGGTSLTGGTTGAGTGGTAGGAAAACPATPSAVIVDFSGDASAAQVGTPYKGADTGLTVPTVSTTTGALVVDVATGPASTTYPYAYVGLPFNACVDGSAYTGVTFTASGTLSAGCTIQFSVVDKEHSTTANNGTCTVANCYASSKIFTLPATPTPVTVAFTDQSGGGANAGAAAVDPTEILNIQWQLNVPAAPDAGGCTGNFTIDDVMFSK